MKEEHLIFIVSQPRAGSTYLQNLLSNNQFVNTSSEPWILLNYLNQIKPKLVSTKPNNKLANEAFLAYMNKYSNSDLELKKKEYLLGLYTPMLEGFQFVIDKTPRYWEILDDIRMLFPKSKLIILKRNPIDVIKSMVKTWNMSSLLELNHFRRDILWAPKKINAFCNSQKDNANTYCLRYEDLINDTKNEVQKLYEWIGLDFNVKVLDTSKNEKYKGKFGDPYQNSEVNYNLHRKQSLDKEIPQVFKNFIKGYIQFLGTDFFKDYGNYDFGESSKTRQFKYFMHLKEGREERFNFIREAEYFLKEIYYSLFSK